MFIVKYFKWGFQFPKLLTRRGESIVKMIVFFLLLTFIANFPLTWLAYEYEGTKINFIEENLSSNPPSWQNLPNGTIHLGGVSDVTLDGISYSHNDYIYYFGYDSSIETITDKNIVIFHENNIQYIDINKNTLYSDGYSGFKDIINLNELNLSSGSERVELFTQLGDNIERSFSNYIVFYAVIRNQIVQIASLFIFVILLTLIIQLFRFGFQNFLSLKDSFNFVILSTTLPSVLSLIFGLILPGFAPVVFNLVLGMTVMLVLLVFSRKSFT